MIPQSATPTRSASQFFKIGLWIVQIFLAVSFIGIGIMKLTTPIDQLTAMMKWPGDYPPAFVRCMGVVDLLGGLGVLLPSVTRIFPGVAVLAALCCTILQVVALSFHLMRGEASVTPLNVVLLAASIFVFWGRRMKAPIAPRG